MKCALLQVASFKAKISIGLNGLELTLATSHLDTPDPEGVYSLN